MTKSLAIVQSALAIESPQHADLVAEQQYLVSLMRGPLANAEEAAIQVDHFIKGRMRHAREEWVLTAQLVYIVRETKLWEKHPAGFTGFLQWAAQPEIDLAPSTISDMMALAKNAPAILAAGVDIWECVRENGQSKVRQLVPEIRRAIKAADHYPEIKFAQDEAFALDERYDLPLLFDTIAPMVEMLQDKSYREVIDMTSRQDRNVRTPFELAARYIEHRDGLITVVLERMTFDKFERVVDLLPIKRWFDKDGHRIPHPLDFDGEDFDNSIIDVPVKPRTPS